MSNKDAPEGDYTDDEMFEWIVAGEAALDEVVENLAKVGVKIEPYQRDIVVRWLGMFGEDSPVPIQCRVAMLRGWLFAAGRLK